MKKQKNKNREKTVIEKKRNWSRKEILVLAGGAGTGMDTTGDHGGGRRDGGSTGIGMSTGSRYWEWQEVLDAVGYTGTGTVEGTGTGRGCWYWFW